MPEKVRVGIIGAGKIAQARHIPLMQSVGDVYITHAWSRTPETAQKAAREFVIPNVVDRWEEIVDSPQIDAVRMLEASKATDLVTALYPAGFGLKGDRVMRRLLHDEGYVGEILEVRVTSVVSSIPEVGAWVVDPEVVGVNTMMLAYRIDRRLTDFAGPDCDATLSFRLPFEPEDSQYGKYWTKCQNHERYYEER